ncbi:hypothetical protein L9F63_007127 [Diploptera punctata]|uniref:C2H2-type domain-containing protein n=1 Tax=Diploptera punctata TaxID=6984 RepID=A0AAD8E476_DIPPU|nr:hypothetical protein L9F63_007127 [Diploptera punctata]
MSSKRISRENRKGRGRIKCNYDDSIKLNFGKLNTDTRLMCSKTILQEDNQDVVQSTSIEKSSNELEVTATNFSLPNHIEMVQDIGGVSVDEWLKQKTESVSSIDLDVVMKNDGIDSNYLTTDNVGYHFLTNKEVDMTYVVTNICDIGLGLDLPSNASSKPKTKPDSYIEKDCDSILKNYSTNQDPMLNDLSRNDLLDKDILDENTGINNAQKVDDTEKQSLYYVIGVNDGQFMSVDNTISVPNKKQSKEFKENLWSGSVLTEAQTSLETSENLSITTKRIVDAESEKETGIDFPEFNLITFQVGSSDSVCNIAQLPQMPIEFIKSEIAQTVDDSVKNFENNSTDICSSKTTTDTSPINISDRDTSALKSVPDKNGKTISQNNMVNNNYSTTMKNCNSPATPIKKIVTSSSNPRSLLKNRVLTPPLITKTLPISKKPSILKKSETSTEVPSNLSSESSQVKFKKTSKKPPSMAIIAISTDKSKNTTEIIINTPYGEQVFKGKTTDLMKATAGLWQKMDSSKVQEIDDPLILNSNGEKEASDEPTTSDIQGQMEEDIEELEPEEEQPVTEALAELGIDLDNNNIGLTTIAGHKVWLCPFKGCGKMYQRQCMLKVHILSHFNVRPYRCNVDGCHWSFYTYFKLKRHKKTHLKKKDFVCTIQGCDRRFTTVYNLNAHQKLHERPLEMICPVEACAARFQTKRSLEMHMKSHDKQHAPYKCQHDYCGKHYYSLNALNSHLRCHQHKEEDVRCQWEGCGKVFDKPCRLKAHMRSHTGDKPYLCKFQDCGWAFSSASKLKRHQHKHTNERKFSCDVEGCGKSFMRSEHLKEHILTHVGQRNFQCPVENCGVKFSAKSSLYVHLKKHGKPESAENKVVYHCPIEQCVRTYTCKSSLRQHMLKFHTPVLASDPSQLDHITLLAGDDDLTTLEGLQFSGEITTAYVGIQGALNTVSLVANPSILMNGDAISNITPEYVTAGINYYEMARRSVCRIEGRWTGSTTTNLNNSVITHVLLAPPETQSSALTVSNSTPSSAESSSEPTVTTEPSEEQPLNMSLFEPDPLDVEPETNGIQGSARTSFTYQDIMKERERRKANLSPIPITSIGMRAPTDVVLGTGLHDIPHNLLLQDDLTSNHQNLYTEDHLMTVSPGVGEFQVLLLDPSTRQEFAESTINLRDLE